MIPEIQAYVGPQPFEEKDKGIFFGRDREARDLLSLVIAHNIVLVYAQSGAGKTSLINAGLIPLLKENQFEVFPVVRVKGATLKDIGTIEISNIFVYNALTSLAEGDTDIKNLAKTKLVDFLSGQKRLQDEDGLPLPRAVIVDQFEEIFSLYQDRWKDRKGFFEQISDALEADPLLRVVFVMREDFIAQLDPYVYLLPERLRTRFHLECLRREAALMAVKGPLRDTGHSFAEGVAEKLIDELLTIQVETIPGIKAQVTGEFIEAVQLQVVCQSLWQGLSSDERQITFEHLKYYGNVEEELSIFYDDAIGAAAKAAHIDEEKLRTLFIEAFITTMETRSMEYRAQESTGGIPNAAIDVLENLHLIRAEWRAAARWYELTHDRFIKSVLLSNKVFNDKLAEKKRAEIEKVSAEEKKRAEKERIKRYHIIKGLAIISVIVLSLAVATFLQLNQANEKIEYMRDALQKYENNPVGVAISPDGKSVYVTNYDSHTVSVINTSTNNVTDTLSIGFGSQGIAITPDGTKAYLAHLKDNNISVIDTSTNNVTGNISVSSPYGLGFTPDGTKLYVANNLNSSVSVIDAVNNTVITTVPVGSNPQEIAISPDGTKVYVTSDWESNISVIDTVNNTVIAPLPVGSSPQGIAISPDGTKLYVANGNSKGKTGNVSVISTTSNNTTIIATIPVGGSAQGIVINPDGTKVYVVNSDSNTVSVINASSNNVIATINVLPKTYAAYITNQDDNTISVIDIGSDNVTATVNVSKGPVGVAVTPDRKSVYVTNYLANTVSVIDTAKDIVTATIEVGNMPFGVAVTPDGSKAYVTNWGSNNVSVIDTSTNTITATVQVGTEPEGIVVTPDGKRGYVVNAGSDNITVIDIDTNNVSTAVNVGDMPIGIAVTPDGTKVFVTDGGSSNVSIIDTTLNTITVRIPVGRNPQGITITPDGNKAYVANGASNTVSVIDTTTNTVISTVNVEKDPFGISVSPDGSKVYVVNGASNTVSVINTTTNTITANITVGNNSSAFGQFIGTTYN